jgi:S-adenosylmethionine:tRNA ribosyltransferase-isomerase
LNILRIKDFKKYNVNFLDMKLSQFRYNLPQELIALYPTENRDESRLMVVNRKAGTFEHTIFKEITGYFHEHDVLVFNNTKVFPARLYGNKEKTGAEIEVFLLRELNREQRLWDVLVDPARKIRIGNKLYFGEDDLLVAEVIDNTTSRGRTLRFLFDGTYEEFKHTLYSLGETPLPVNGIRQYLQSTRGLSQLPLPVFISAGNCLRNLRSSGWNSPRSPCMSDLAISGV